MARLGRDPTGTILIRRAFERDITRRLRRIARDARRSIVDNDALGIRRPRPVVFRAALPGEFAFATDDRKVEAFLRWLNEQVDTGLLEVAIRDGQTVTASSRWSDFYVQSAYKKGLTDADGRLLSKGLEISPRSVESALAAPIHADRIGLLFTRTFTELQGIGAATAQILSRELAQGMAEGVGAETLARRISQATTRITRTRARVLARTEVIRAHAEGTLNEYESLGIDKVSGLAEFSTAGDDRVCQVCLGLEGQEFTLNDARGVIPVHAQCRCVWLPVLDSLSIAA